jgi:hypothetical protein
MDKSTSSTNRRSVICPVLALFILIDYIILIHWSNGLDIAWLVLPAAGWLNHCPEIIATLPRATLAVALIMPQEYCQANELSDLIPERTAVIPPPIMQVVPGVVKQLPHV